MKFINRQKELEFLEKDHASKAIQVSWKNTRSTSTGTIIKPPLSAIRTIWLLHYRNFRKFRYYTIQI